MKKLPFILTILCSLYISAVPAQETNWGEEFSDAIMDRHPNSINDLTGKGWEYSNSIVLYGMMKIYHYSQNPDYLDYVKKYVDSYVDANGNIRFDSSANNLDHIHPGLLLVFLYEETGLEKYKKAADKVRAEFDTQPRNPSGGYWHKQKYPNQMWADGIYMAEPFLLVYGKAFDDLEYAANEASFQTTLLAEHAYSTSNHLIYHGWDETKAASWADDHGRSPMVWSRGMGWYCMALVDMLDNLPTEHEKYNDFISLVQGLAQGIKETQDEESGLWYQVVDRGDQSSNWIETSGSAMFLYMLKKAITKGYLDSSYTDVIDKGWAGMQAKITLDSGNRPVINGFVGGMGIKDSYSSYVAQSAVSTPTSSHPHGYCAILSLASVMEWPKEKIYQLGVSEAGNGEVISTTAETLFMPGRYVKLTARPQAGNDFTGWTGDLTSADTVIYVKMDASKSITANFSINVAVNQLNSDNELTMYPNPTSGILSIQTSQKVDEVTIFDIHGSLIRSKLPLDNNSINLTDFEPGVYFVECKIAGQSIRRTIVKK
jgi:unsaturated rhamnogalacturonyl hydrolase